MSNAELGIMVPVHHSKFDVPYFKTLKSSLNNEM